MEVATDAVARGRWVIIGVAKGTFLVGMEGSALGRRWRGWGKTAACACFGRRTVAERVWCA